MTIPMNCARCGAPTPAYSARDWREPRKHRYGLCAKCYIKFKVHRPAEAAHGE